MRDSALVELRILGSLQLRAADGRQVDTLARHAKRTALLAYLAASSPRGPHRRDTLLALFWPESDAPHARAALNQALYVLRSALGEEAIAPRGDGEVVLSREAVWCDAAAFEAALDAGRPGDALALYRGDLLEGFFVTGAPEFERWLERERARLRERASQGAWALAEERAAVGDAGEAGRWARRAADLLPADEITARRLMTFLNKLGDRAAAVAAYDAFVSRLAAEYELEPSSETQALADAIRKGAPRAPASGRAGPVSPPEPPAVSTDRPKRPTRMLQGILAAATLLGALVIGVAVHRRGEATMSEGPRVLVLPFQNLGAPADAYFADGITDEITARLATVSGLQVIGGQSALHYRGTDKTPRQIAAEIGADYLLEGTVSWQRSQQGRGRVRVRPQLIHTRDETQVWATVLDEDLTDLFPLLSEVALRVVSELHVALAPPRQQRLAAAPTTSLEAYDYFLRGRAIARGTWSATTNLSAIQMFERAAELDSQFALAYARLSFSHTEAYWLNELGPEHLSQAKAAAEHALELDPNLPDAHVALGHYFYACCADYDRALQHLNTAYAARPGDAQIVMLIGNVYKRRGDWRNAIRSYERSATLDPRWDAPLLNLGQAHLWLRHYDEAERVSRRALSLEPREGFAYATWASVPVLRDGDLAAAQRVVLEAAALSDGNEGMTLPFYLELMGRRPRAALARASSSRPAGWAWDQWLGNEHVRKGVALRLLGDSAAARQQFDSARAELEGRLPAAMQRSLRAYAVLASALAVADAALGRRAEAIDLSRRVAASDPPAVDAIAGPGALQNLALAYVFLNDNTSALNVIERLLSIPSCFSPQLLRLDPLWDPLRGDPRFERLARVAK